MNFLRLITTYKGTSLADLFSNAQEGSVHHRILNQNVDMESSFKGYKSFKKRLQSGEKVAYFGMTRNTQVRLGEDTWCMVIHVLFEFH